MKATPQASYVVDNILTLTPEANGDDMPRCIQSIAPVSLGTGYGFVCGTSCGLHLVTSDGVLLSSHLPGTTTWEVLSLPAGDTERVITAGTYGILSWSVGDTLTEELKFADGGADWLHVTSMCVVGDKLVTADESGQIRLWKISTGAEYASFLAHSHCTIHGLAPLPGNRFVSGSDWGQIRVWDADRLESKKIFAPGSHILHIGLLAHNTCFVALGYDGRNYSLIFYDSSIATQEEVKLKHAISTFCECADGLLAFQSDLGIAILDHETREWISVEGAEFGDVSAIAKLGNGDLVVGNTLGSLSILNFTNLKWKVFYRWLFLGNADSSSPFHTLPKEVLYHIVKVTFCNLLKIE